MGNSFLGVSWKFSGSEITMLGVALCMEETLPGSGRHTWMDARRKRGLTLAGKDRGQKEKRATEDEMVGWHQ